jgi:transposase InsO family protein
MKDKRKAEDIAAARMQLLAPLFEANCDPAKNRALRAQIRAATGISERTLRRYLKEYQRNGFNGLKPKGKGRETSKAISPEVLEQAVLLRREVPARSVAQLIQILEWEGIIKPGEVKRSTLQDRLMALGYSTRHMRMYAETGTAARRFQKRHRNKLWHSDLKYGPYLPIGPGGEAKQVYLVTFIDDATRFVLHGEFYAVMDQSTVEDCFRKAIQKHGTPEAVYFDNGKQYRTKWMQRTCALLGMRLIYAKPYQPEATGKVERFNRVVDSFLGEAALEKPKTLERLNELFWVWLSECYQNKPHSALDSKSPESTYKSDRKEIRFVDAELLANAFLHCETRKVDKVGCISFMGRKYEVGLPFIGHKVTLVYDPRDTTELTVEREGHIPFKIKELVIGEKAGQRPSLPPHMQKQPAEESRLLAAAKQAYEKRQDRQLPAVSYRAIKESSHV